MNYLINRLIIFKDYQLNIENRDASDFIKDFQNSLYSSEDALLDVYTYTKNY